MPALSCIETEALLVRNLPPVDHRNEIVEAVERDTIRPRLPFRESYLGADHWRNSGQPVFSGPTMMGFAETAMYACVHAILGEEMTAVTSTLTVTFIRPAGAGDLMAAARLVRAGSRQAYVDTYLYADGEPEALAHVTGTYHLVRGR